MPLPALLARVAATLLRRHNLHGRFSVTTRPNGASVVSFDVRDGAQLDGARTAALVAEQELEAAAYAVTREQGSRGVQLVVRPLLDAIYAVSRASEARRAAMPTGAPNPKMAGGRARREAWRLEAEASAWAAALPVAAVADEYAALLVQIAADHDAERATVRADALRARLVEAYRAMPAGSEGRAVLAAAMRRAA